MRASEGRSEILKMNTRTPLMLCAAVGLALTAGAASLPVATTAAPPTHQSCFWGHDVENFNAPDDRHVYLRVGVNQVYALTLFAPCLDIDWNQSIGLVAQGGGDWICEGSGLNVEVVTHATGLGRQRCQVTSVRKLSPAEVTALPKKYRP
jgi:hypothetical protein